MLEVLAPDLLVLGLLGSLAARDLGALGCASRWARRLSSDEAVWRAACLHCWRGKQHSVFMRRWLAETGDVDFGDHVSVVQSCHEQDATELRGMELQSWRQRYKFAWDDRERTHIWLQELCEDASLHPSTGRPCRRRWHLRLRLERWQDKEVVFHPSGGAWANFNINVFQRSLYEELPWRPAFQDEPDFSDSTECGAMERAQTGSFPFVRLPSLPFLLRVHRAADWGWALVPHDGPSVLRLASRQLSAQQQFEAELASPALFTLYLEACSKQCGQHGFHGIWQVKSGFQGTMPASSWLGATFSFRFHTSCQGVCGILHHGCDINASCFINFSTNEEPAGRGEGGLVASLGAGPVEASGPPAFRMTWRRGQPSDCQLGAAPALLLLIDATPSFCPDAPAVWPSQIPAGLPPLATQAEAVQVWSDNDDEIDPFCQSVDL